MEVVAKKVTQGLSRQEAQRRLSEFGRNEIIRQTKAHPIRILVRQFTSPLILLLIAAAIVSLAIGFLPDQEPNVVDALLILFIVILSGVLGFIQDYNAERTIEALQKMATPHARVIRDGQEVEIPSAEVVPDDLLLLESGDMVTADGKVVKAFHLELDESVLTGESAAVRKEADEPVFMNTYVTGGNARVLVTETGMRTQMGHVASRLQTLETEKSSFQVELGILSKRLSLITLVILVVIAIIGVFKYGFYTSLLTAISLAVAAIPEGLPAVVVLALAAGARVMFRKHALIRRLPIVESVGAVNIVCTDKTGTLTHNEMTVTHLHYDGQIHSVDSLEEAGTLDEAARQLLRCGQLCNNAMLGVDDHGEAKYFGEQTEIALLRISQQLLPTEDGQPHEKVNEISFNSERKMMSVVVADPTGALTVYAKGAPEVLIAKCTHTLRNGEVVPWDESARQQVLEQNVEFASQALRVLGFAYKPTESATEQVEENLVWLGLQAMIDPPRDEVAQAIQDCKTAGIRVIMITGDNPVTAQAIAEQVGLESSGVLGGPALDQLDDDALRQKLDEQVNIFARTNPFHKLRLLEILEVNNSVAMTGDGVNDALAIKKAEVGIAMGLKGTEVTKQASDLILLDDNFSTIRDAIKEGRTIFNNIRKFLDYLLTCNLAEVSLIFLATLLVDLNEPLLFPVQLLWVNLLTDGLVALALGVDPPAQDIMQHKPRPDKEPLINKRLGWLIALIGTKKMLLLMIVFLIIYPMGLDIARSALLTGIVLFEFVRIGAIRYQEKLGWLANRWLVIGLAVSLLLQLIIVYSPINEYFYLVPLGGFEWMILLAGVVVGYLLAILITRFVVQNTPE
ncbi:MAG: cation-translocating P-type ATPase [Bacteroidota bacterium]